MFGLVGDIQKAYETERLPWGIPSESVETLIGLKDRSHTQD